MRLPFRKTPKKTNALQASIRNQSFTEIANENDAMIFRSSRTGGFEGPPEMQVIGEAGENSTFYTSTSRKAIHRRSPVASISTYYTSASASPTNDTGRTANSAARSCMSNLAVSSTATTILMGNSRRKNKTAKKEKKRITCQPKPIFPYILWRCATEDEVDHSTIVGHDHCSTTASGAPSLEICDVTIDGTESPSDRSTKTRELKSTRPFSIFKNTKIRYPKRDSDEKDNMNRVQNRGVDDLKDQKAEDDETSEGVVGSLYSFIFSQCDEGAGFELDTIDHSQVGCELLDLDEDSQDGVSTSSDLRPTSNATNDGEVNHGHSSPSAMKLTAEILSQHDKRKSKELLTQIPVGRFDVWKHGRDTRRFHHPCHDEGLEKPSQGSQPSRATTRRSKMKGLRARGGHLLSYQDGTKKRADETPDMESLDEMNRINQKRQNYLAVQRAREGINAHMNEELRCREQPSTEQSWAFFDLPLCILCSAPRTQQTEDNRVDLNHQKRSPCPACSDKALSI